MIMLAFEILLKDMRKSSNFVINSINRNSQVRTIRRRNNILRRKVNSFKELLPRDFPPRNVDDLERHIAFVEYYAERNDYKMMKNNANDFPRDIEKIESEIQTYFQNWVINIPSRDLEETVMDLISEAVYCYKFGAHRSAIVMAGASIEHLVRQRYHELTGNERRASLPA